ncbi:MAG: sigma-54 dependent transcriptional regulator [Thermodesulfovibrionales bacterium]
MEKILVVDDERNILLVLNKFLRQEGFQVETARSFEEAVSRLAGSGLDLIITDMRLPGKSGLELLKWVKEKTPELPVIVITAYGSIENAVEAMKIGAANYLTKPIEHDEMLAIIKHALIHSHVTGKSQTGYQKELYGIIGNSRAIRDVLSTIDVVSRSRANILITGESGTGKELVAKAIHRVSQRREFPFVAINCAAIPKELIENELFGHEAGAYTGAISKEAGKIEMADRGTLFLDEIGDMPLTMQIKLLRFIQEKEFYRIGGTKPIKADCRIIAATNRNLEKEIETGGFREDIYYRLNVISIHMPPLRERKEDIPLLVDHFIKKYALENQKLIKGIDGMAMDALLNYGWPGNIRELENIIERAIVLTKQEVIALNDLPAKIINKGAGDATKGITDLSGLKLDELERAALLKALEEENWNQTRAAARLGITRRQLRLRMVKYRLIGEEVKR